MPARRYVRLVVVAMLFVTQPLASPADAAAGELDPSFGGDGIARWNPSSTTDGVSAIAVQPDGRTVTAGLSQVSLDPNASTYDLLISRHNGDGSLDTSFGGDGAATTDSGSPSDSASAVAIQPDRRIVAVGSTLASELVLVRYNADGTTDTTFGGGDGMVMTRLLGEATAARDVAVDATGRIVIAGSLLRGNGGSDFLIARYRPDGTLDPTFGGDGVVTTDIDFGDGAEAVALQPNGKLVAAGYAATNFAVVRYNPKGSLDTTFSGDGKVTTDFGSSDRAFDVGIDAHERIVAAGKGGRGAQLSLARYTPEGAPDATFDGDGKVKYANILLESQASDNDPGVRLGLDVQPDGKPVVGGTFAAADYDFGLARSTVSGALDTTFGGDGMVTLDLSSDDYGSDVAADTGGNLIVAGSTVGPSGDREPMLVRYLGELAASACPGMTITNTVAGTADDDTLIGTPGSDFIYGLGGNDTITGGNGNDCIYGGAGNDALDAGAGNDRLFSEAGNDTLTGGTGLDKVEGQAGDD